MMCSLYPWLYSTKAAVRSLSDWWRTSANERARELAVSGKMCVWLWKQVCYTEQRWRSAGPLQHGGRPKQSVAYPEFLRKHNSAVAFIFYQRSTCFAHFLENFHCLHLRLILRRAADAATTDYVYLPNRYIRFMYKRYFFSSAWA